MEFMCAYCQKHSCHKKELENVPKNCSITKEYRDILELYKEEENYKIAQAEFLNEKNTDLNAILGLCVGHDSLFF